MSFPNDADGQTLAQLQLAGADLSQEREIEFFLVFTMKPYARLAQSELKKEGYTVRVRPGHGGDWTCIAVKRMVPTHAALMDARTRLGAIATTHRGQYDGWGSPVE